MIEKTIELKSVNPVDIFGVNERHLDLLKNSFPKLKIVSRGNLILLNGSKKDIASFEEKLNILLLSFEKFGRITNDDIANILSHNDQIHLTEADSNDILVRGKNGILIKARTPNQFRMAKSCEKNDLLFSIGPAGTGKTYTAVALAVRALRNKEVKRIILTRPAVEAGENLGFLPGDMKEKLDPYMQPLYDALRDMIPTQKLITYLEEGVIEIAPLAFMRGRTLDNAFVILDEAQNTTFSQLKMFLTRMGRSAKFIVTGDLTQIDLPRNQKSGLIHATHLLKNIKGIDFIFLNTTDIIRHKLVTKIINAFEAEQDSKN